MPPPRLNLVRYHGVLAPNAAGREQIVPGCPEGDEDGADTTCSHGDHASTPEPSKPTYRLSWARLLARVFRIDVTECPHCGGRMKIIAALTEPAAIRAYLDCVGLDSHPPPVAPPRPQPQTEFEYAG